MIRKQEIHNDKMHNNKYTSNPTSKYPKQKVKGVDLKSKWKILAYFALFFQSIKVLESPTVGTMLILAIGVDILIGVANLKEEK